MSKWDTCNKSPFVKGGFRGNVNMIGVAKLCFASPFIRTRQKKDEQLSQLVFKTLCHTLTDYRTIVEDFYKVVEFVEWLKEYYPEKIPLIIESK